MSLTQFTFVVGFPIRNLEIVNSITLDRSFMKLIDVKEGDTVYVEKRELFGIPRGPVTTMRVIGALSQDVGKRIVRFTEDVHEFSPGDQVIVYSTDHLRA